MEAFNKHRSTPPCHNSCTVHCLVVLALCCLSYGFKEKKTLSSHSHTIHTLKTLSHSQLYNTLHAFVLFSFYALTSYIELPLVYLLAACRMVLRKRKQCCPIHCYITHCHAFVLFSFYALTSYIELLLVYVLACLSTCLLPVVWF